MLGTRDYCAKNGFTDVVIGLSGGIDSTIVACIAADALGAEHVHGVSMPSRYSSDHSKSDAELLADEPRHRVPHDPDRAVVPGLPRHAGSFVRRPRARPHVREHPEPLPRSDADGAVERVRLDGAHHRQQERDGCRLLHDLRRFGRRVRGDQGRAEDPGVRPVPVRQPHRRARDRPRERDHQAAVGRAAPRPARRPEPAAVRRARSDPRAVHRGRPHRRRDHRARPRRGHRAPHHPARSTSPSTSAGSVLPACGCPARRSARTAGSRSPTAIAADRARLPFHARPSPDPISLRRRTPLDHRRQPRPPRRRALPLEGHRHAAVAILLVDSEIGSDGDDAFRFTAEQMSIIPSDVTGLDGRMAGRRRRSVVRAVPPQRRTELARLAVGAAGRPHRPGRDRGRGGTARDRRGGRRPPAAERGARRARRLPDPLRVHHHPGGRVGGPGGGVAARIPTRSSPSTASASTS